MHLKDQEIFGYEALYRKNDDESYPSALKIISDIFSTCNTGDNCHLFINLTINDVSDKNFCHLLLNMSEEKEIDPSKIVLEINESTHPDILTAAKKNISLLHHHNVKIALDDFGTEYSSLFCISEFPVDIVKIDKKFIKETPSNLKLRKLLKHCVEISHDFGCKVVAEGIENKNQLECVMNSDADIGQGFLFSAPSNGNFSPFINLTDFGSFLAEPIIRKSPTEAPGYFPIYTAEN